MKRPNPTLVLLLPLLLAACGGTSAPGNALISVAADKTTIALTSTGASATTDTSTNFTFTNKAGGAATDISSATLKFGTSKPITVSFPNISVTSGFSCADGSTSGCSTANLQFTASTITKALKDADLFGLLPALNGGQKSFPVELNFAGVANPLTFTVNVGAAVTNGGGTSTPTPATSPAPVVTINTTAAAPYTGNLNVTVSGNFDATSTVERLVLQTIDVTGSVDSTSYVSNQPTATFSVDTSKFPDGNVLIRAIAITKSDANNAALRGESVTKTITVQNITPPVIALASPSDGSTVTTANMPVQITITRKNSAFTVPGGQIVVNLLDYRGQPVATQTITGVQDNVSANYTTSFDVGGLPVDTYTLSIKTPVAVAGGAAQTVTTVGKVTTKSISVNPPAAVIRFPVAIPNPANPAQPTPAVINSSSGALVQVSDETGIAYIQVRFVKPDGTILNAYLLNQGFSPQPRGPIDIAITSLDIDGSQYVPNGPYTMRVTVADSDGNRNVQEIPVTVDRTITINGLTQSVAPSPTVASTITGQLTYTSANWTINGLPTGFNPNLSASTRVSGLIYKDNVLVGSQFGIFQGSTSTTVSYAFGDAGLYRVDWIVEDLVTGAVRYVPGTSLSVTKNP